MFKKLELPVQEGDYGLKNGFNVISGIGSGSGILTDNKGLNAN